MTYKKENKAGRVICWMLFLAYIAILVYFLFFSEKLGREATGEFRYNLRPFQEIIRCIRHWSVLRQLALINLVGNVVAFMPFGFFLPLLSVKERRVVMILLLTFELSLVIEVIQLFTGVGSFDVDDLLLNTIGGWLGYGCYCLFAKMTRNSR